MWLLLRKKLEYRLHPLGKGQIHYTDVAAKSQKSPLQQRYGR